MKTDHDFFVNAAEDLEQYIFSNELYWPLGRNLPPLTPGNLLLCLIRLKAFSQIETPQDVLIFEKIQAVLLRWRVNWEKKMEREFEARYSLWQNYLASAEKDGVLVGYANQVKVRVILDLLQQDFSPVPEGWAQRVMALDVRLRRFVIAGKFVWEETLQSSFPPQTFWYLYTDKE
jgi:hypothetical protein